MGGVVEIALGGLAEQEAGRGRHSLFCAVVRSVRFSTLQCLPTKSPSKLEGVLRSSGGVCFGKGKKGKKGKKNN